MAQFSKRERLAASVLSKFPRLKSFIKKSYVTLNYIIHRKSYRSLLLHIKKEINLIEPFEENNETFFGYYDKSPENNNGLIIYNETSILTSKKPSANRPIWINILNTKNHSIVPVSESFSYNWQ